MNKIILAAAMQLLVINYCNAQEGASRWRLNFSGAFMQGRIKNQNMENDKMLTAVYKSSVPISLGFSCRIGKGSYFNSGLRLNSYKTEYISRGSFIGGSATDADGY